MTLLPNKSLLVITLIISFLILSWLIGQTRFKPVDLLSLPDHSVVEFQLDKKSLQVEVANTPGSITRGLGGRDNLTTDGMLFVFSQPILTTFWMKEMRFPIDIVWLNNGQIVGIERDIQPPVVGTPDDQLERFSAPSPVDMVLETTPYLIEDQL
ncbi:MAG TPA: DUF192 domain-containing protein [Patescibacteria group bacterium]|jgi:hypothetical protein